METSTHDDVCLPLVVLVWIIGGSEWPEFLTEKVTTPVLETKDRAPAKAALQKQPCKGSPAKAARPGRMLAKEAPVAQIGMTTLTVRKVTDG
jgi:hypothetical protein